MSIEKLLESKGEYFELFSLFNTLSIIFGALFLLFAILLVIYERKSKSKENNSKKSEKISAILAISELIILAIAGILAIFTMYHYAKETEKWEKEVAYPYLDSMEKQRVDIMGVDIDGNDYVTIYIKDGKSVKTQSGYYEVETTLKSGEQEYFEFVDLKEDLSPSITKGYQNVKVYVPEDYKF